MDIELFDERRSIIPVVFDHLAALQALAEPVRFAVFNCIRGCGGASAYDIQTGQCDANEVDAVAVCDFKCQLPCAPSTLTHHLNVMRDAGLIETERRGRNTYVRIRPEAVVAMVAFFGNTK